MEAGEEKGEEGEEKGGLEGEGTPDKPGMYRQSSRSSLPEQKDDESRASKDGSQNTGMSSSGYPRTMEPLHPEYSSFDAVKHLQEHDPQFEAFQRMTRRQNPQGVKLFRGKGTKAAKARPHNPLGQKAVIIHDSRGLETSGTYMNSGMHACMLNGLYMS